MQTISSVSKCSDRDIIRSLMKTLWRFSCSVQQMRSSSLWSCSHGWLKRTICYCSAEPQPLWTQKKGNGSFFLFIDTSNNIWCCHVCLRVKLCVCVCMWERETWSYLYVTVGKHLSITRGENWNINSKSTCTSWLQSLQTHTHTPGCLVILRWCQVVVWKVP